MSCITEFNKEVYEMGIREEAREEGLEEGRKEGRKEGHKEGRKEGRLEALVSNVISLMKSLGISVDEACKLLQIAEEDYEYIKEKIK